MGPTSVSKITFSLYSLSNIGAAHADGSDDDEIKRSLERQHGVLFTVRLDPFRYTLEYVLEDSSRITMRSIESERLS